MLLYDPVGIPSFIQRWKEFGEKEKESVFRFFCYYTAFNFLYNRGKTRCVNCDLCDNIVCLCKELQLHDDKCQVCNAIRNIIGEEQDFNPFEVLTPQSEIITQPVFRQRKVMYGDCSLVNIQALFLNIYQIRCNLYHGSKEMRGLRDKALVKEAADVLELFLNYVVDKYN